MKKIYMAPHMTVEQVKVNCSMLTASIRGDVNSNGSLQGANPNSATAKERNADVWSTDKNNLDWDF